MKSIFRPHREKFWNKEELTEFPYSLVIPWKAYQKIMSYANACDVEITQFADIVVDEEERTLTVGNVYLLPQRASGSSVSMEEEDVSNFMVECIRQGITELPRCWIHSHVDMEAFFSGTDVETYTKTLNNKAWTVALVVNKQQEMKAVFQLYNPFPLTWKLRIFPPTPPITVSLDIQKEVKEKVKKTYWGIEVDVDEVVEKIMAKTHPHMTDGEEVTTRKKAS